MSVFPPLILFLFSFFPQHPPPTLLSLHHQHPPSYIPTLTHQSHLNLYHHTMILNSLQINLIMGTSILVVFDIIWFYFHDILTDWFGRLIAP